MKASPRVAILVAICVPLCAQLPLEPPHDSGQSITGAFEGWFQNSDGSFSVLVGYYNRNLKQEFDIPVGPNNRIEPGGPDRGQPTHFLTGRQWGVFTIRLPKDFGDNKLTWTLVANRKTTVIPLSLNTLWEVSPYIEASANTPPFISFDEAGESAVQGPPLKIAKSFEAAVSEPLSLTVWVADDAKASLAAPRLRTPPVILTWSKFRGPGSVEFSKDRPAIEKADWKAPPSATAFMGKATTTATFSEPGEYILEALANDSSGEGGRGFQCCWTTAQIKISVKAAPTGGK
jgi:hypothetical protein